MPLETSLTTTGEFLVRHVVSSLGATTGAVVTVVLFVAVVMTLLGLGTAADVSSGGITVPSVEVRTRLAELEESYRVRIRSLEEKLCLLEEDLRLRQENADD